MVLIQSYSIATASWKLCSSFWGSLEVLRCTVTPSSSYENFAVYKCIRVFEMKNKHKGKRNQRSLWYSARCIDCAVGGRKCLKIVRCRDKNNWINPHGLLACYHLRTALLNNVQVLCWYHGVIAEYSTQESTVARLEFKSYLWTLRLGQSCNETSKCAIFCNTRRCCYLEMPPPAGWNLDLFLPALHQRNQQSCFKKKPCHAVHPAKLNANPVCAAYACYNARVSYSITL